MENTYKHFLHNVCPYIPFFITTFLLTTFALLGLFPSQMVHLLPVPDMEWAVSTLSLERYGDPRGSKGNVGGVACGMQSDMWILQELGPAQRPQEGGGGRRFPMEKAWYCTISEAKEHGSPNMASKIH